MKRDIEKLFAALRKIALTARERSAMRARIAERMSASPVTFSAAERPQPRGVGPLAPSPFTRFIASFKQNHMAPIALGLIIMLTAGSGVAFAAEGSVPGDALYPVKVNVEEKVAGAFALSPQAKADFSAHLADERLKEAATLSADNKLTPEIRSDIRSRLAEHLADAQTRVTDLKRKGRGHDAAEVETKIKTSVGAHADILKNLDVSVSFSDTGNASTSSESGAGGFDDRGGFRIRASATSSGDSSRNSPGEDSGGSGENAHLQATTSIQIRHGEDDTQDDEGDGSGIQVGGGPLRIQGDGFEDSGRGKNRGRIEIDF